MHSPLFQIKSRAREFSSLYRVKPRCIPAVVKRTDPTCPSCHSIDSPRLPCFSNLWNNFRDGTKLRILSLDPATAENVHLRTRYKPKAFLLRCSHSFLVTQLSLSQRSLSWAAPHTSLCDCFCHTPCLISLSVTHLLGTTLVPFTVFLSHIRHYSFTNISFMDVRRLFHLNDNSKLSFFYSAQRALNKKLEEWTSTSTNQSFKTPGEVYLT